MSAARKIPASSVTPAKRIGGKAAGEPTGGGAGFAGHVAVDGHFDQVGASHVAERFERNGDRGDGGLPPVGQQVMAKPAHQPRIVDFADGVFVALAQLRACGRRRAGRWAIAGWA